jgi:hypothetical protein
MAADIPVSTDNRSWVVSSVVKPVLDFDTKQPRLDANGAPMYSVELTALGGDGALVVVVRGSGSAPALSVGIPVRVRGLVATPWAMGDRTGLSYRAEAIEALPTPAPARPVAS